MRLRLISLFTLILTIAGVSFAQAQSDRAADREAIRAHIDSIFQAFIKKDVAALRATHADNWLGYLEGSRTMIKGIEGYMDWNQLDTKSPPKRPVSARPAHLRLLHQAERSLDPKRQRYGVASGVFGTAARVGPPVIARDEEEFVGHA